MLFGLADKLGAAGWRVSEPPSMRGTHPTEMQVGSDWKNHLARNLHRRSASPAPSSI